MGRALRQVNEMRTMSGPFVREWREKSAAALNAVLLDEPREQG